jgi:hypothetical protein
MINQATDLQDAQDLTCAAKRGVRYQFWMRSNSVSTVSPNVSQLVKMMPTSHRLA